MASKRFPISEDEGYDEVLPSPQRRKLCCKCMRSFNKMLKKIKKIKKTIKSSLVEMNLIREELRVERVHTVPPIPRQGVDTRHEVKYRLCFTEISPRDIYTMRPFLARVTIFDANSNAIITSGSLSSKRIEIVVLTGEFGDDGQEEWTEEEFNKHVAVERIGKGQLLKGQWQVNLDRGKGTFVGMVFTDNSSWTTNGKFRLGARMLQGESSKEIVKEARSQAFIVKDVRAESCQKIHPPSLNDEVWRLEKIWKGGQYCKRLEEHGIKTVQDFLYWLDRDEEDLRCKLGRVGRKNWEAIVGHARESVPGEPRVEPIFGPDICLDASQKDKVDLERRTYEHLNDTADASQIIGSSSYQPQNTIPLPIYHDVTQDNLQYQHSAQHIGTTGDTFQPNDLTDEDFFNEIFNEGYDQGWHMQQ